MDRRTRPLIDSLVNLKALADLGNSVTDQLAFTSLLTSGEYGRHLRHMRRRYASRRKALIGALAQYLPHATVAVSPQASNSSSASRRHTGLTS